MDGELLFGETRIESYLYKGVAFELILRNPSLWAGAIGYAENRTDEPDIDGLMRRYQLLSGVAKRDLANPQWSACISIGYWRNGEVPRGMMFAQEVLDSAQDPRYDLYETPESLYIRVSCERDSANKLLSKESCYPWELFDCAKEVMALQGYAVNDNGAQEMEMYLNGAEKAYAYVPVKR